MSEEMKTEKKRRSSYQTTKFYTLGNMTFKLCDIHSIKHKLMFSATETNTENIDNALPHTTVIFTNGTDNNYLDEDKSILDDLLDVLGSEDFYKEVKVAVSSDTSLEDDPEENKFDIDEHINKNQP